MYFTLGGPAGPVKFFRSSHVDDWNPTFYEDFQNLDGDGSADMLDSYVSGVTQDIRL